MGEAPHQPPPAASGDGGGHVAGALSAEIEAVGGAERFGPLAVRRFRKPDGRALILYERAREDGDG